ncbi:BQ2448_5999 [Microbotryum intermedium]|uniref:BQ2448_5999 protein n=1 Tax=Microbotryum intermedium TaxID=269621 RepID=A0A238F5Y8_9BASI|nr:BQ2448_5999 [Microbotryum intermedium]
MAPVQLPILHLSEGLTIDMLYRFVTHLLLDPRFLMLLTLVRTRAIGQSPSNLLRHIILHDHGADPLSSALVVCLGMSLVLWFNSWLSHASRNNWVLNKKGGGDNKWGWDERRSEVVVITGGLEMVRGFVDKAHAKVVILDVVEPKGGPFPNTTFYHCDLASPQEIKKVCQKVVEEVGQPSVLINNAGVVRSASILDSTTRDIDLTYDINVKSHYYTVQAFLPGMIKMGKGHIVTIASNTAYIQAAKGVSYAASKSSTLSFHEGLTEELRHMYGLSARSIRTSAILPGHVRGPMFDGFATGMPEWLMPSLEPKTVAGLVVRCVMSGESQFVIEPLYAKALPLVRALPTWVGDILYASAKNSLAQVQLDQSVKKVE